MNSLKDHIIFEGIDEENLEYKIDIWFDKNNDVKKEFEKFSDALENAQKRINTASSELETLVGTRTRMLRRQLQNVTELDNSNNNQNGV